MIFEDKNIVDNALNLWAGLLQSQPGLFEEFMKMPAARDILMDGLLHCKAEAVREQFKALLSHVCRRQKDATRLAYIVSFIQENVGRLSGQPSRQFLGLTVSVLDDVSLQAKLSPAEGAKIFDPDRMLFEVIQQMTQENVAVAEIKARSKTGEDNPEETAAKLEQSEEFLLGLMYLAGRILEAFDSGQTGAAADLEAAEMSAQQLQRSSLIHEIFARYLFPMVFGEDGTASSQLTIREVIDTRMRRRSQGSAQSRKSQASVA